ncbi:hypothetical protein B7494_g8479 [Chlorociboria aeruginascens]|nr:hypothetical protein B7494_g8479 [Chlorociboria aeruginascens]
MSSSQPYQASSPMGRKKSKYTYKHLAQLALSTPTCPLRVISHLDIDAAYAQFEMWCEGDEKWAYHDDAAKNIATHKVSLDPYRIESRRIFACIKEILPAGMQKVEKASIDEVFMDLSPQIHSILLDRYPELAGPAPYDDLTENLPLPPTTGLDWKADALIDLDGDETEADDPDWDDIAILLGSEIVRAVRAVIREKLQYTCSAGIARNKMLAKLGSAYKKPNQQTVVRNRAIQHFLSDFKYTKIRGLGGKLGEEIVSAFKMDTVKDLLPVPVEQLKRALGDDTGTWVYEVIRGTDLGEVNPRTQIKSMLSAKSFRPTINTLEQAIRWLRIFVADIYSRLVEEGVSENKRRPKTINLHHRQGGQTRSRQAPIPQGKKIDEVTLFDLAKNLLHQIVLEGRVWPCANLSLSVGGFEDGVVGNMGIGAFLVKGDEAKELNSSTRDERPEKRRRVDDRGIQKFFSKADGSEHDDDEFGAQELPGVVSAEGGYADSINSLLPTNGLKHQDITGHSAASSSLQQQQQQQHITDYICTRCNIHLESADTLQNHQDWHFAKDLHNEDRGHSLSKAQIPKPSKQNRPSSSKKNPTGRSKPEKGQSKLAFG